MSISKDSETPTLPPIPRRPRGGRLVHHGATACTTAGVFLLALGRPPLWISLAGYSVSTGLIILLGEVLRRKPPSDEGALRVRNEELEQRVRRRTRELTAANDELEAFCHSVAHDLRTPLRSIDGFSQILTDLCDERLQEEERSYFRRIRAASQKMAHLIDGLLDLAKLVRSEMHYSLVDMSGIAEEIAGELRARHPERRVDFMILPGMRAHGDRKLIHSLLLNLFENAWKFTSKHAEARIEFGTVEKEGARAYFIRDDGAGFDMAYAGHLFKPFERLHGGEFPGTGIGLATVHRIVHRHGGRIWSEGALEKGAAFYFTLARNERPVKAADPRRGDRRQYLRRSTDRRPTPL